MNHQKNEIPKEAFRQKDRLEIIFQAHLRLEQATTSFGIFEIIESTLSLLGTKGWFMTRIPMPGQSIKNLKIVDRWKDGGASPIAVPPDDVLIQKSIDWPFPFVLHDKFITETVFAKEINLNPEKKCILVVPIDRIQKFHGTAIFRYSRKSLPENSEDQLISFAERNMISAFVNFSIFKYLSFQQELENRLGELTQREREVLSVASLGYRSTDIAKILGIKSRTVTAHLQNLSKKLNAKNKTECVLQGMRYKQTGPGAGFGFYQIENEIFHCHNKLQQHRCKN